MKASIYLTVNKENTKCYLNIGQFVTYNEVTYKVKDTNGFNCDLENTNSGVYGVPVSLVKPFDLESVFKQVFDSVNLSSESRTEILADKFKEEYADRNKLSTLESKQILQNSLQTKMAAYKAHNDYSSEEEVQEAVYKDWAADNKIGVPNKKKDKEAEELRKGNTDKDKSKDKVAKKSKKKVDNNKYKEDK